jgi:DNA-directed RNA polymerase specialized sigma subunit
MYIKSSKLLEEELRKITIYRERLQYLYKEKHLIEPLKRYRLRLEIFICVVDEALNELSPLHKEFFQHYYEKGKNLKRISIEMALTDYTVEKLRQDILDKVSEKLGLLQD